MVTIRNANKVSVTTDLDRTLNQQPKKMKSSKQFISCVQKSLLHSVYPPLCNEKQKLTPFLSQNLLTPPLPFSPCLLKVSNHFDPLPVLVTFAKGGQNTPFYLNLQLSLLFLKKKVQSRIQQIWNYLPHPPPAIGGGLGPPPQ